MLAALPALSRLGWVNRADERSLAAKYSQRLRVKAPSLESITAGLSGGNRLKIALAKGWPAPATCPNRSTSAVTSV